MRLHTCIALVVVFSCTSLLFGQPSDPFIVAGPNGDGIETSHELFPDLFPPNGNNFVGGWLIGDEGEGISGVPVVRDDNAGQWIKHLYGAEDRPAPISANENGIHPPVVAELGDKFVLVELLQVFGDASWSDWHEEIRTPGWVWIEDVIPKFGPTPTDVGADVDPGLPVPVVAVSDTVFDSFADIADNIAPGLVIAGSDTELDFFFDTVQPGENVAIVKVLQFVGTGNNQQPDDVGAADDETFEGVIEIAQFPTPEPLTAALSMMSMGALMIATRRRRGKRTIA